MTYFYRAGGGPWPPRPPPLDPLLCKYTGIQSWHYYQYCVFLENSNGTKTLLYIGGSYARAQRNQQAFCRYQYVSYGSKILTYLFH